MPPSKGFKFANAEARKAIFTSGSGSGSVSVADATTALITNPTLNPKLKLKPKPKPKPVRKGRKRKCDASGSLNSSIYDTSVKFGGTALTEHSSPSLGILNIRRQDVPATVDEQTQQPQTQRSIPDTSSMKGLRIDLSRIIDAGDVKKEPSSSSSIIKQRSGNLFGAGKSAAPVQAPENEPVSGQYSIPVAGVMGSTKNPKLQKLLNDTDPAVYLMFHSKGDKTRMPKRSDKLCWWCCHSFDTEARYAPTRFDEKRSRYCVIGNFCSWQCAKSYSDSPNTPSKTSILCRMFAEMYGALVDIPPAPPKEILNAFGGTLSIEEFRNISPEFRWEISTSNMLISDHFAIVPTRRRRS